jgi:hypothetical protein
MTWIVGTWLGCGAGDPSATQPPPPPPPPALGFDLGDADAGVGAIPCEHVRTVSIVNQDEVEHRIESVAFVASEGEVRLDPWDLVLPQVVQPDRSMEVPLRDAGQVPGPTRGTLSVVTEIGTFEVVVEGERTWGDPRTDTFVVQEPEVDVVLAVDQSGNMPDDYADDLASGLGGWLDALSAAADWRLILVHAADACADGPVYEEGDRQAADDLGRDAFSGAPHPFDERLLELASRALAENAPTECNGSFRRDDAQLHVVVVSDEPEQSGRPASFWVDDFYDYADDVVVSGIVDAAGRCNGGDRGYDDAIAATGGRSVDLCSAGWSGDLEGLADVVVAVPARFPLAGGAVEASIDARVNGRRVAVSWSEATGLLTVEEPLAPGTRVDVGWAVPAQCGD